MEKRSIIELLTVILIVEKIIQHLFVTWAFYTNFESIRSTIVPNYTVLMISGFIIAIFFIVALFLVIKRKKIGLWITLSLAILDIVGEFYAQGTINIIIVVSFIIAWILLFLCILALKEKDKKP